MVFFFVHLVLRSWWITLTLLWGSPRFVAMANRGAILTIRAWRFGWQDRDSFGNQNAYKGVGYGTAAGAAVARSGHGSCRRSSAEGLMLRAHCSVLSARVRTSDRSKSYLPHLWNSEAISDMTRLANSFRVSILCCGIFKRGIRRNGTPRASISTSFRYWRLLVSS